MSHLSPICFLFFLSRVFTLCRAKSKPSAHNISYICILSRPNPSSLLFYLFALFYSRFSNFMSTLSFSTINSLNTCFMHCHQPATHHASSSIVQSGFLSYLLHARFIQMNSAALFHSFYLLGWISPPYELGQSFSCACSGGFRASAKHQQKST